jgi:hypothetical protein
VENLKKRKMEKTKKINHKFLLEFEVRNKQDCKRFYNLFKKYKKNILKAVYYPEKK